MTTKPDRDPAFRRRLDAIVARFLADQDDHDALLAALTALAADARAASSPLAPELADLATRVDMIAFTVCAAERRPAICELLSHHS